MRALLVVGLIAGLLSARAADVVINEVMYHPPGDRDDLQYIEVFNRGAAPVDLTGWSFTKGITFTFPKLTLPPGGFAVVSRNPTAFATAYTNLAALGPYEGRLKHGGERIELADAAGKPVDSVKFTDRAPWPASADGTGASLERICPAGPGDEPANWTASTLPLIKSFAGTPGRTNSAYSVNLPPIIEEVTWTTIEPNKPITVTAKVRDADGIKTVSVRFRAVERAANNPEQSVVLQRTEGDDKKGTFTGTLPAQTAGKLLRFVVEAADTVGSVRLSPAASELRPTYSAFVVANTNRATVAQLHLVPLGPARETRSRQPRFNFGGDDRNAGPTPSRGDSAVLYLPTNGPAQTFDFVRFSSRSGGWKVRLPKDNPLAGVTTWNVQFEGKPRYSLAEYFGYELFRRLGMPTPATDFASVTASGRPKGYYLMIEQPNSSFLRRHKLDPDGNMYKLLWYGQGVVGQHEKKNNPETGHKDLIALLNGLKRSGGDAQWEFIQQNFDVPEFVNCYVGSMCIQNWDGFFNNYFTYHAPGKDGKWQLIQWDLDKTWGDFDGASSDYDWYSMPLDYGSGSPGSGRGGFGGFGGFGFGGGWQRPPGFFSGPLLANPGFRKQFTTRLREALDTVFNEKDFIPYIDAVERRLAPEARLKGQLQGGDGGAMAAEFKDDIESFRQQIKGRRKFLLNELKKEK